MNRIKKNSDFEGDHLDVPDVTKELSDWLV